MQHDVEQAADGRGSRRWILALVAVALALRLPGYAGWWFNPDEAIYLEVATTSAERARAMVAHNAHPPLQYLLLRSLARISTSPLWLRLPSLLAGVALVPLMWACTRRLAGSTAGLAAAAIVAVSPSAVALSGVMRPYALQQAALALAFLGWVGWVAGAGRARLALFALAAGVAMGLQYSSFAALATFGGALVLLLATRRVPLRRGLELAAAHLPPVAIAAYLYVSHIRPILEGGGLQADAREGWLRDHFIGDLGGVFERLAQVFKGHFGVEEFALAFAALSLVLCLRARKLGLVAPAVTAVVVAVALSVLGKYPLGGSRHSAWMIVFLAPLVADGIARMATVRTRWLAMAARLSAVVLLGGGVVTCLRLAGGRSHGEFLSESVVRSGEAAEVREFLAHSLDARAVLLTDQQSLNLLRAALNSEEPTLRRQRDTGLSRAIVGERTYLFLPSDPERPRAMAWELAWVRERSSESWHLARALELLEASPPLAARAREHGLWLLLGGWSANLAHAPGNRPADAAPLYSESAGGPGLGLFRLDLEAYAAYLADG